MLDSISVILWVVLYDLLIQPYFARKGRPISLLVRIGIGYLIAVLAMVAAAGRAWYGPLGVLGFLALACVRERMPAWILLVGQQAPSRLLTQR